MDIASNALARAAVFVLALGMLARVEVARADVTTVGASRAQDTPESNHHAAVAAYAKGRYRDAIELFRVADRQRPSPAFSFNVARCYEQLGDEVNALAWYRDYLRRARNPTDAAAVTRVIARFENRLAQKGVQQVSVRSFPNGATVAIDGTPVGVSPWIGTIAPGVHSVALTLAGYEPASDHFELPPQHARDVELRLIAAVSREPRDALIATRAPLIDAQRSIATSERQEAETRDRTSALRSAGWSGVGAAGAALVGAVVFEVLRRGAEADARGEATQIRFAEAVDTMQSRQTAARVLAGTAVGLGVAGGVLLLVAASQSERATAPNMAVTCTRSTCNASLTGRF